MLFDSDDNLKLDTGVSAETSFLPDASTNQNVINVTVPSSDSLTTSSTSEIVKTEAMATHGMDHAHGETEHSDLTGHDSSGHMAGEPEFLELVPRDRATHVAVKNGDWFNPDTWQNRQIPGNDADVLIPQELDIFYGRESGARLDTLRVDGSLRFVSDRDTKMLIDTFAVAPQGSLIIGSENSPVEADKKTEIIFTSDTAIDPKSDQQQFGRGLISHGKASIHGADKLDFISLKQDALQGDDELVLDLPQGQTAPLGWKIGDRLVLGGTFLNDNGSNNDNTFYQDEVLTITAINGDRIRFTNNDLNGDSNNVLRFDHERPEGFENELDLYVANTTRNVSFSTENGDNVPINHRGHVMLMHNTDVVVENAGFYDLGRTDKKRLIDDPVQNVNGSAGTGQNPRGRYALHIHKAGLDNPNSSPVLARGNAIVGSPGWGVVHHSSHAVLEDNVVFDVVGAGIVAEAGDELGAWRNNITIKTTGDARRADLDFNSPREFLFDFGFNGESYWVQGAAQVAMTDNVAISSRAGIALFGLDEGSENFREAETIPVSFLPSSMQNIAKGTQDSSMVDVSVVPIRELNGFTSYNSTEGILVWGRMQNSDGQQEFEFDSDGKPRPAHNFESDIENFKLWNITGSGVGISYSTNINLEDGLILGNLDKNPGNGLNINDTSNSLNFKNIHIEGFANGIEVPYDADRDFVGSRLEDSYLANNQQSFAPTNSDFILEPGHEDFSAFFQIEDLEVLAQKTENLLPRAEFSAQPLGGLSMSFDASNAFDPDSLFPNKTSKGIVSYAWDFDGDGQNDSFGRQVDFRFQRAGAYNVGLTVWDSQGATHKLTKTIKLEPSDYRNGIINSEFDSSESFGLPYYSNSSYADQGWYATKLVESNLKQGRDSAAILTAGGASQATIGQVIQDNYHRKGKQSLSLQLKNIEDIANAEASNQIQIGVWGVNGEFDIDLYSTTGPKAVGNLPITSKNLLTQNVGGSNFDWRNFEWDLDLGNGYQFIVVQISGKKLGQDDDYVAIDNVMLE